MNINFIQRENKTMFGDLKMGDFFRVHKIDEQFTIRQKIDRGRCVFFEKRGHKLVAMGLPSVIIPSDTHVSPLGHIEVS